jgi:hypothetical protein
VLGQRALAADVQHRALGAERRGDAGHRVGAARAGGGNHATQLTGLARVAICRVRRCLLVAHIDYTNTLIETSIINIDDMATT